MLTTQAITQGLFQVVALCLFTGSRGGRDLVEHLTQLFHSFNFMAHENGEARASSLS